MPKKVHVQATINGKRDRVPVRAAAEPARSAARRAAADRQQGRLQQRQLRRLQRHARRPAGQLLPGLGVEVAGPRRSTTIEGVATPQGLHPLQQKFLEHAALQCGICTPGFIVAAKALLDKNPKPTEARRCATGWPATCAAAPATTRSSAPCSTPPRRSGMRSPSCKR